MINLLKKYLPHRPKTAKAKTGCYTYFTIVGDFNPDEVTELLDLNPFNKFSIGEDRPGGKSVYDFARWSYGYNDDYDGLVEKQLIETIKDLNLHIDTLNEIKRKYNVSFSLEIVPEMLVDDVHPAICLNKEIIEFCYLTQTEIDIDMYIYNR